MINNPIRRKFAATSCSSWELEKEGFNVDPANTMEFPSTNNHRSPKVAPNIKQLLASPHNIQGIMGALESFSV